MKTLVVGDLHLKAEDKLSIKVSESIIDYISSFTNKVDRVVLLGDLVESAQITGTVNNLLYRLMEVLKAFKRSDITVGNHDFLTYGKDREVCYSFFRDEGINVYDKPYYDEELKELFVPYYLGSSPNTKVFYEKYLEENEYFEGKPINNIYAHVVKDGKNVAEWFKVKEVVDFDKLEYKNLFLGHIHTRYIDECLGSIVPNKVSEYDKDSSIKTRCLKLIEDNGSIKEIEIPHFVRYETVEFPNEFEKKDDLPVILTVTNVEDFDSARLKYESDFIKIRDYVRKTGTDSDVLRENINNLNEKDLFIQGVEEKHIKATEKEKEYVLNKLFA